jgi:hypothetical protein
MPAPRNYVRGYSFAGYQATNPNRPLPGPALDNELEEIEQSLTEAISGLNDIRRADGQLRNGIVGRDALAPDLSTGVRPATLWQAGIQYQAQDTVSYLASFYRCTIAHLSTDFLTDLTATRWELYADIGATATDAQIARNEAVAARNEAVPAAAAATAGSNNVTALYDLFDDRYLGEKTALPTLDNDGNALVNGAIVSLTGQVNPAMDGMYIRRSGVWQQFITPAQGVFLSYRFVATAAQTVFSGADANGVTLAYTPGAVVVTLNGAALAPNTYTASNGSSLTLGTAAGLGDTLLIHSFGTFALVDTYTRAQADGLFAPSGHVGAGGAAHANATTSVAGFMSTGDKTKLDGVASGSTANSADATLLARANHTGTQAHTTITGLGTAATVNTGTGAADVPTTTQADARYGKLSGGNSWSGDQPLSSGPWRTRGPWYGFTSAVSGLNLRDGSVSGFQIYNRGDTPCAELAVFDFTGRIDGETPIASSFFRFLPSGNISVNGQTLDARYILKDDGGTPGSWQVPGILSVVPTTGSAITQVKSPAANTTFLSLQGGGRSFLTDDFNLIQHANGYAIITNRASANIGFGSNNTDDALIINSSNDIALKNVVRIGQPIATRGVINLNGESANETNIEAYEGSNQSNKVTLNLQKYGGITRIRNGAISVSDAGLTDFSQVPTIASSSMDDRYGRNDHADIRRYGGVANAADNTTAWLAAVAAAMSMPSRTVYLPPGQWNITDWANITVDGFTLRGAGKDVTTIAVLSTFNLARAGVINAPNLVRGVRVCDLQIICFHANTAPANRGQLTAFPPVINSYNSPALHLDNVRISLAMVAIDARGNSGQAVLENVQLSQFEWACRIDGALDTWRGSRIHDWWYNSSSQQQAIMSDATAGGFEIGRCDGLDLTSYLAFKKRKALRFYTGSIDGAFGAFGTVSGLHLDDSSTVLFENGDITLTNGYATQGPAGVNAIDYRGGHLLVNNFKFMAEATTSGAGEVPLIEAKNTINGLGSLQMQDSVFELRGLCDRKLINITRPNAMPGFSVVFEGNTVVAANISRTDPLIDCNPGGSGIRLRVVANTVADSSTGPVFVRMTQDDFAILGPNITPGWSNSLPGTTINIKQL